MAVILPSAAEKQAADRAQMKIMMNKIAAVSFGIAEGIGLNVEEDIMADIELTDNLINLSLDNLKQLMSDFYEQTGLKMHIEDEEFTAMVAQATAMAYTKIFNITITRPGEAGAENNGTLNTNTAS